MNVLTRRKTHLKQRRSALGARRSALGARRSALGARYAVAVVLALTILFQLCPIAPPIEAAAVGSHGIPELQALVTGPGDYPSSLEPILIDGIWWHAAAPNGATRELTETVFFYPYVMLITDATVGVSIYDDDDPEYEGSIIQQAVTDWYTNTDMPTIKANAYKAYTPINGKDAPLGGNLYSTPVSGSDYIDKRAVYGDPAGPNDVKDVAFIPSSFDMGGLGNHDIMTDEELAGPGASFFAGSTASDQAFWMRSYRVNPWPYDPPVMPNWNVNLFDFGYGPRYGPYVPQPYMDRTELGVRPAIWVNAEGFDPPISDVQIYKDADGLGGFATRRGHWADETAGTYSFGVRVDGSNTAAAVSAILPDLTLTGQSSQGFEAAYPAWQNILSADLALTVGGAVTLGGVVYREVRFNVTNIHASGIVDFTLTYTPAGTSAVFRVLVPGDVSKDGRVNSTDLTLVFNMLKGAAPPTGPPGEYKFELANLSPDSNINSTDYSLMMNLVKGSVHI
jgi:hypothetical protein